MNPMTVLENKVIKLKHGDALLIHTETYNNKGGKNYTINVPMLRSYLEKEGFRNYNDEPIFVTRNLCKKVTPDYIFKHVLGYIETFDDSELEAAYLKQGETILIKNKAVILGLPMCEIIELRDTKETSYQYYKNGIVKVAKNNPFKVLDYKDAKGFIWENRILDREFDIDDESELEGSMFSKFLKNITIDKEHYLSLCSAIGYLLHKYKDQRNPICIIINDANLENDGQAEGGTGKGLIIKAISEIVEKALYNGKNSDFSNNKFAYQNVTDSTNIICIDDASRNFYFEALFSSITDDLVIERKHQTARVMSYTVSPKFVITTNYAIKGFTSSSKRRRFDVFLKNHYSADYSPQDDFKCEFFHDWDKNEWAKFDFFMMSCIKIFLEKGLIKYENEELKLKKLYGETNKEFFDIMEEEFSNKNVFYNYSDVRIRAGNRGGRKLEFFLNGNSRIIVDWIKKYGEFKGSRIITRDDNGKLMRNEIGNGFKWEGKPNEIVNVCGEIEF